MHGQAPDYLSELCTPVAQVAERQHLRSTSHYLLIVTRFQLDTYGRRTFAVAGPTTWNLFQNNLREPDMQIDCFCRKGKGKGLDTCYSATYMSQTCDQQCFTISEVAADWHEPMVPQRIMWPSIARANGQLDPWCS